MGNPGLFSYFQVNWLASLILCHRHIFWGCRHGHLWKATILPTNDGNVQHQCCLIPQPLATCGCLNLIKRKTSSSVTEITSPCAWHTVMSVNTKHYSLEQRKFITGSYKEMGGSCPQTPKVTESFQQVPLKAKGEGWVWLVVTDFSLSDPLFLRPSHGQVTMFL